MATTLSQPGVLVFRISQIANLDLSAERILSFAASELATFLPQAQISVTFKTAQVSVGLAKGSAVKAPVPVFVFSRPLRVRGFDYGTFVVESPSPSGSISEWMTALETVSTVLALSAEQRRLLDEQASIKKALSTEKLISRAGGIVAEQHGLSLGAAHQWLAKEAARTGRSLRQFADMLILNHMVQTRLEPSRPPVPGKPHPRPSSGGRRYFQGAAA